MEIKLGMKIKDTITGIEGICVAKTQYLTNCTHYSIQPKPTKDKPNSVPDWVSIDESRVAIVSSTIIKKRSVKKGSTSGPTPEVDSNW